MDYVIQCRFAPSFTNAPPMRELFPNARDMVLFSYAFTVSQRIGRNQAARLVEEYLRGDGAKVGVGDRLDIQVERVTGTKGSIIITLLVTSVVLAQSAGPVTGPALTAAVGTVVTSAGGIALWAADKVLGGTLSEFGAKLAVGLRERLSPNAPTLIRDPATMADTKAAEIAKARLCTALPSGGGVDVKLPDGAGVGLKYTYQLVGAAPGWVTIVVDQHAQRPLEYHVYDTAPVDVH
jgi:hypothetical protein